MVDAILRLKQMFLKQQRILDVIIKFWCSYNKVRCKTAAKTVQWDKQAYTN